MKYPFSDPATKIQRAYKHLAELETEARYYIAGNPAKFDIEIRDAGPPLLVSVTFHVPGVPAYFGAIVGDIIHNLRTALDLTACEAVRAAGGKADKVYFPFSDNANELERAIKFRKFDRAGPAAVELLRIMQPYRNGNRALRVIHDLDIRDKHQSLIPGAISAASPVIQMWEDDGRRNPRVIGDPNAASEIRLIFPPGSGLDRRPLIPTLHELVQLVEGIVEAFRALANRDADDGDII
jgi:hypothetical protein